MNKIILLNAPPKNGKDYTCNKLQSKITFPYIAQYSIAKPLKDNVHSLFHIVCPNGKTWDDIKDISHENLNGKTLREAYIDFSENVIKKHYGQDFWIKRTTNFIKKYTTPVTNTDWVITDLGFDMEAECIVNELSDMYDIYLVRLHANHESIENMHNIGTFPNDSRKWVFNDKCHQLDIINDKKSNKHIDEICKLIYSI
jgi:hypothetical protein